MGTLRLRRFNTFLQGLAHTKQQVLELDSDSVLPDPKAPGSPLSGITEETLVSGFAAVQSCAHGSGCLIAPRPDIFRDALEKNFGYRSGYIC